MMKKAITIVLALLFLLCPLALAEEDASAPQEAAEYFLESFVPLEPEEGMPEDFMRPVRAYRIQLPEDTTDLPDAILEAYGAYDDIYLIAFQIPTFIGPITQELYKCAGRVQGGEWEACMTPQDLRGRTFAYDPLNRLIITEVSIAVALD